VKAAQIKTPERIGELRMKNRRWLATLLIVLPVSTFVAACGSEKDTDNRAALEREALERDLNLALQPDTTAEPVLNDVPVEAPSAEPPAAQRPSTPAPKPAPRPSAPAPRPSAPAPSEPARPRTVTVSVPSGTTFAVRMNQELSTRNSKAGTTFTATLAEPIYAADGSLLVPSGATVRGRVTEAKESGRAGESAVIRLAFDNIAFDGNSYPISATAVDVPIKKVTRDSKTEQAAKIGGGAAVGAVLGQVLGKNTKSTVAGAAIGAAAGTAVAMGTADVDAVVPSGARVVIRLDSPVRVEKEV
jgi:hypothetical protein